MHVVRETSLDMQMVQVSTLDIGKPIDSESYTFDFNFQGLVIFVLVPSSRSNKDSYR